MRIRILQTPSLAAVDGVALDMFQVGRIYEVGSSLATLFLAEGWAEPLDPEALPANLDWDRDRPYLDLKAIDAARRRRRTPDR